jgi:hypothetical protein
MVHKWTDIVYLQDKLPRFLFRGHSDNKWNLKTSLERSLGDMRTIKDLEYDREDILQEEFIRNASLYMNKDLKEYSKLQILATMQHYGAPTRLLDVTKSFYIALYFTSNIERKDACIWAFNYNFLVEKLITRFSNLSTGDVSTRLLYKLNLDICEDILYKRKGSCRFIIPVESYFVHQREFAQQGLYLFPGTLECDFEEILYETFEINDNEKASLDITETRDDDFDEKNLGILKIHIPYDLSYFSINKLQEMNITEATLFPGLEGFSRSLNRYTRIAFFPYP